MARKLPNFLREREIASLLATAQAQVDQAKAPARLLAARRDRIVIAAGLLLGLRVSELAKLDVADVDFDQRTVFVRQGKGSKDRVVYMSVDLVKPLQEWLGGRTTGPVFAGRDGKRPSIRTLQVRITKLGALAGLPKRLKAHTLRHSFATSLKRSGVPISDIQALLGHSSINTTAVYLHCEPEQLRSAVDRLRLESGERPPEPGRDGSTPP